MKDKISSIFDILILVVIGICFVDLFSEEHFLPVPKIVVLSLSVIFLIYSIVNLMQDSECKYTSKDGE